MKIQLLSDLHIEFEEFEIESNDADVLILAGDIHAKHKGVIWAIENIPEKPVLYVLGNHEFYGKAYPKLVDTVKGITAKSNVHVLERDTITIDGINFFGCTLWTSFELFGDPRIAGHQCQQTMTDYKKIRVSPKFSKLRSIDVASIHMQSVAWLEQELKNHAGETNIVITHHGPSIASLPAHKKEDITSAAYVSNLETLIRSHQPRYWFHGHLHNSSNYLVGSCRVICNPKGYPDELNPDFEAARMIELKSA